MNRTDSELWELVAANDATAWSELVDRYKSLVYSVATFMGLSQADAADCFQQTWVLLYEHRRQLRDASKISSWLVTTAKREALRLRRGTSTPAEKALERIADSAPAPDDELLMLEKQTWLNAALREIDLPCRKLLDAFFFSESDSSYEDIARELGYSTNTLGAKRLRCMKKLRAILEKNGYWRERI